VYGLHAIYLRVPVRVCYLLFIDVRDLAPPYCIYAPHSMYYAAFKDIYNTCVLYLGISHTFWWRGGAIGKASGLRFACRSRTWVLAGYHYVWSWASYLHMCGSVTNQHNLAPAKGWFPWLGK